MRLLVSRFFQKTIILTVIIQKQTQTPDIAASVLFIYRVGFFGKFYRKPGINKYSPFVKWKHCIICSIF